MNTYELAEKDYQKGMKYKDIAEKYNVSLNTVKSWKVRYKWKKEKVCTQNKSMHTSKESIKNKISNNDKDSEWIDEIDGLSDKQRLFCYYYMESLNVFQAGVKAGYSPNYSRTRIYEMLEKDSIKAFLKKLREQQKQDFLISQEKILNRHVQVAFSDINEYFEEDGSLKPITHTDGSLIKKLKITETDKGTTVEIELIEKCKSLDALTKYIELDPDTNIAKQKLEIEKERKTKTKNNIPPAYFDEIDEEIDEEMEE